MATTPKVLLKRSSIQGRVPNAGDLEYGEIALNFADGKIYYKDDQNNVKAFIDSAIINDLVNRISLDSADVLPIIRSISLDSSEVMNLIYKNSLDSDEVIRLVNAYNIDSAELNSFITNYVDSAFVQNLQSYDALTLGNNDPNYYNNYNNLYNKPNVLDSADIQAFTVDSNEVINLVDSAYVQARQSYDADTLDGQDGSWYRDWTNTTNKPIILDIVDVRNIIFDYADSDYVQERQDYAYSSLTGVPNYINSLDSAEVIRLANEETLDSAEAQAIIDSNFQNLTQSIVPADDITVDLGSATNRFRDLYLGPNSIFLGNVTLRESDGKLVIIDAAGNQAELGIDSQVVDIITDTVDSAFVNNLVDSARVVNIITETAFDSAQILDIVDERVTKTFVDALNVDADTLDGYHAQYFIDKIDSNTAAMLDSIEAGNLIDSAFTVKSTSDLSEGSNLYYTQGRFDLAFAVKSTSDLSEGSNLYYTQGRFDSAFADKTTDDLTEGSTNQYYLKSRVDSDIAASLNDSGNTVTVTINNVIEDKVDSAYVLARIDEAPFLDSADAINLIDSAYVQLRQDYAYSSLTGVPTNVSQFNNDANYIATGDSASLASLTTTGDVTVGGNLQVNGTTFTVNSETLSVGDNLIYMNQLESDGSPTLQVDVGWAANVNDNGTYTHVGMFRDATDDTFKVFGNYTPEPDSSLQINTAHASFELAPFAAKTLSGQYLGFDSDFNDKTTTDLTEGTNLYYTTTRANADIDARVTKAFVDALNIDADQLDGQDGTYYLNYNNFTNTPNLIDSGLTIQLIDSAYVQARQSGVDSAAIIQLIDSAYVNARVAAGTDSATVSAIIVQDVDSAYVQARQLNEVAAPLTQSTYSFEATQGQISFTGLDIDSNKFQVYLNGLLLPRADYTHNTSQIDLLVAADSSDVIEIIKFTGNDTGAQAIEQRHYIYTATSGQTVFTGADDNSATLSYTEGRVNVYLNGLLLLDSDDYTQNGAGDTITFTTGVTAGHIVDIQTLSGNTGTFAPLSQTMHEFTADSGQTVFTGLDNNSTRLAFSNDKIAVYLNGILLSTQDYTTSNGNTITLDVGADSGNLLTVSKISGNNIGLDSGQILTMVDSAYVQARSPSVDLSSVSQHIIPSANATYDLGDSNNYWRDLYLSGNTLVLGNLKLQEHTGRFRFINRHSGDEVKLAANNIGDNLIDSSVILRLIDSAHIAARTEPGTDSAAIIQLIDSAYIQARQITYDFLDSAEAINLIDSAYIQARSVPGTDSAAIIQLIDSAYVQLRQDYDYNNLVNTPSTVDSTGVRNIVTKQYIDSLGVDAGTVDGYDGAYLLNYNNLTNKPTVLNQTQIEALFANEIETLSVVGLDHLAYIHDSDNTVMTVTVDAKTDDHRYKGQGSTSSYTINGREAPFLVLQPGQTYYFDQSDGSNNGHPLQFYYDAGKNVQYTTGVTVTGTAGNVGAHVLLEVTDTTPTVLHYQCANHGYMGNAVNTQTRNLTGFDTDDLAEGSTNLYYTQSRVDARIQAVVNQAFIEARVSHLDSAAADAIFLTQDEAIILIDSAYVQARTAAATGTDSAQVISLIQATVDSAYVIARQQTATPADGLDSATVISLIDSAYVQARQSTVSGGGAGVGTGFNIDRYQYIATLGQKVFTGADVNGVTLSYDTTADHINVYVNGILLIDSDDFTQTDSGTVTLIDSADLNDRITIIKYQEAIIDTGVDSAGIIAIVDSAYVQARQSGVDSAAILSLIDSDYVVARQHVYERGTLELNKYYYTATSGQTVFNGVDNEGEVLSINPNNIEVYVNGILLIKDADYTATTSQITINDGLDSGYSVYVLETIGRVSSSVNTTSQKTFEFTADSGQTVFNGTDNNGLNLSLNLSGAADVYLNGILLSRGNDYTATGNSITLLDAADSGDFLAINNITGYSIAPTVQIYEFEADSGQSVFGGGGLTYAVGALQVHLNGIMLQPSVDYTATNGTSITLTNPADSADEIFISAFSNPGLVYDTFRFLADSDQTVFTGQDLDSADLDYNVLQHQLFINGILIDEGDYTATSNSILTLSSGTNLNDEVKIVSFSQTSATVTQTVVSEWSETTASPQQLVAGNKVFVDVSSSAKTVTLPAAANMGDEIRVIDATGNAATNNITVARNGHNIMGAASDLVINTDRAGIGLVYFNAAQGWLLIEN